MSNYRMSEEAYSAHRAKRAAELARQDGHAISRVPGKVSLVLPWPPTLNHFGAGSHRASPRSEEYKEFRAKVARAVIDRQLPKMLGRLRMSVEAFPPDKRRRDIDNLLKSLLDSLQHAGLYADDEQIDEIQIRLIRELNYGWVNVTVTELAG